MNERIMQNKENQNEVVQNKDQVRRKTLRMREGNHQKNPIKNRKYKRKMKKRSEANHKESM